MFEDIIKYNNCIVLENLPTYSHTVDREFFAAKIFHDCVEFFGDYPQNFIDTDHDL